MTSISFVSTELGDTMKYGEGSFQPCFHRVTSLRFKEWSMGEGVLYNLVFTEWRHCVSQNFNYDPANYVLQMNLIILIIGYLSLFNSLPFWIKFLILEH